MSPYARSLKDFFIVYCLVLVLSNAGLFIWTYPSGGSGSLLAIVLAPAINFMLGDWVLLLLT